MQFTLCCAQTLCPTHVAILVGGTAPQKLCLLHPSHPRWSQLTGRVETTFAICRSMACSPTKSSTAYWRPSKTQLPLKRYWGRACTHSSPLKFCRSCASSSAWTLPARTSICAVRPIQLLFPGLYCAITQAQWVLQHPLFIMSPFQHTLHQYPRHHSNACLVTTTSCRLSATLGIRTCLPPQCCGLRCYIQWTEHWDSTGLEAVAMSRLQPIMEGAGKDPLDLRKLIQQLLAVHNTRPMAGATPRHYIAFVNLYGSLYSRKRSQLLEQQDFLKVMHPPSTGLERVLSSKQTPSSGPVLQHLLWLSGRT